MYPDREALAFYDSVKFVNTEFYQGLVVSKDGKLSGGKMNICTIDQKIHFINDKGDTLVIKDNENVQTASIIGKTKSAVKMRLQKGRRLLRELYQKECM